MKKQILILQALALTLNTYTVSIDDAQIVRKKVDPKHSNIYIQKITNKSSHSAFVALERTFVTPLDDRIDLTGHLMPGKDFQLNDPEKTPYAIAVPLWQRTFRGNTFNIVTLSGNPGRIYFLYVIDGHLWAVKAPSKEGEMKGIHLLDPAEEDRTFELTILDDNVLKLIPIVESKKDVTKNRTRTTTAAQSKPVQKRTAPQASALRQRPTTPQSVQTNSRSLRHQLPATTRAKLRDTAPD